MARRKVGKIELTAYDDLFETDESRAEAALSKIRDIPISEIDEFPDHGVPIAVIGVGKGNRTNIACRKRHLRRHYGQCRDRRQRKGSGFLE